ncbi:LysR substrate-binding domain-containing protein [Lichenibacterium ramalinae]|uniref:LysR substrate-binding domain-containing protein n=1 Tax=Lichenibacterium ramalinae TaxID=2316527 RepID=UPI0013EBA843|nr:LysR substrate-binding domain-containing protein [Lichenibacterium ramalinae]
MPPKPILSRVKTRHLELLVALGQHGSLRRAALALGIEQPAATKLLRGLEKVVGRPLFVRSPRGLKSNGFGDVMMWHARVVSEALDRAQREMDRLAEGGPQRVRVGAVHSAAPFLIARAIARLKRDQPLIVVEVSIDTSNNLLPLLLSDDLDVLVARPWEIGPETGVAYEALIDERLVVVGRAGHPLAGQDGLILRDVIDRPFALLPRDSPMRRVLAPLFRETGVEAPADLVETASIMTIVALLSESDTVAVLPEDVARFYEDQGTLVRLSPALPAVMGAYGIITRHGIPASTGAEHFLLAIRAVLRALGEDAALIRS